MSPKTLTALKDARSAAILVFCVWMGIFLVYLTMQGIFGQNDVVAAFWRSFGETFAYTALTMAIYPVVIRVEAARTPAAWLILVVSTFILSAVLLITDLISPWRDPMYDTLPPKRYWAEVGSLGMMTFIVTSFVVIMLVLQRAAIRTKHDQVEMLRLRDAAHRAEVMALRLQVNPHLLFNSLNAISSLIVTGRAERADEVVGRLAGFLRNALSSDPMALSPLADEIAMTEAYLDIEAVRFGDALSIEIDCDKALGAILTPNYVFQPLVENAMKYAVAPSGGQAALRIAAHREGETLVLSVVDRRAPGAPAVAVRSVGAGVGLTNLRQRLDVLYGGRASLTAQRREDGFSAVVRLPVRP